MSAVIVTGAGGFLGRALVEHLRGEGVEVFAPPRSELDWTDPPAVAQAMRGGPKVLYHLASSGVSASDADDAAIVGAELAMASAIASRMTPGGRLIYAGSMAEYGHAGRLAETNGVAPGNAYARAKVEAGLLLATFSRERDFRLVHARLFGLYGPGEGERRLLPSILAALQAGREIALSDGRQRRDFVHVADAAAVLAALALHPAPPVLVNVGTGRAVEVRAVALALAAELGASPSLLRFGARPRSPHDQDVLEADIAVLEAALGSVPPQRLAPGMSILGGLAVETRANTLGTR